MEQALPLEVDGLDGYKVLANFNGTLLAGKHSKYGVRFVTWDYGRRGVSHGHYFMENYLGAKQDFTTRSGLIPEQEFFKDEQLIESYRCCADTLDGGFDLTCEYGQSTLCRYGADDELLEAMDGYMDFAKLGEDSVVEEGVRQTEFSLVRRCSSHFSNEELLTQKLGDM